MFNKKENMSGSVNGFATKAVHVGPKIILKVLLYILLIDLVYTFLYPFLYLIVTSIKSPDDIRDVTVNWIPNSIHFKNYLLSWDVLNYPSRFFNSLFVTLIATLGHLISCAYVGYGFARFNFTGKRAAFVLLLLSIIVPTQTIIIPRYLMFGALGISDGSVPLWLPTLFGYGLQGGLFIFIFRQFFLSLPKSLEEAAAIDGCGPLGTFFRIAFPSSRSSTMVVLVLSINACTEYAKEIGMDAWVYDENGWPSGFVGGKLLEESENHDRYLTHSIGAYDPEALVSYIVTDDELIRTNENNGEMHLNVYEHISTSTADILNPEVVQKFLNLTHERYKEFFGERFSDYLKGFFTDEPQYYRWSTSYTVMIKKYFKEVLDEDILDGIGLLFLKKKGYRKFRYEYWSGMQKLMLNGFAKMVFDWCDANNVSLTGHYIEENTLGHQLLCCAGIMPFYEYEHIPGIDWLSRKCETPLSARQVSSVAAQLGKKRVLCEMYAGCGWDVTPRELKFITEYLYINGVNLTCQHLLPYSERGNRIHDYPAHYSPINPWVKDHFKEFNDYFTNLGAIISESTEQVRVAVLHPIRSAYFDYDRDLEDDGFGVADLDEKLLSLIFKLEKNGVCYHFIDETLFAKYGDVKEDRLLCGKCEYDVLIIPDCITMDEFTEKSIKKYVENGGKVFLVGEKPSFRTWEEYDYSYLKSNISWIDVLNTRPYEVESNGGSLCVSYRKANEKEFLIIFNHSPSEPCSATIKLPENAASWRAVSLIDDSEKTLY